MKTYTYRIIIEPDENKTYHAYVPALPGCHTWGKSIETARKNIRDAIDAYLRSLIADGERIPEDKGIEVGGLAFCCFEGFCGQFLTLVK